MPFLSGTYNPSIVAISYGVAVLAAFVALDMTARIAASERHAARWWLALGSAAMGVGIWSMHFIGMLAFSLPIPQGYDLDMTILSLGIAIAASAYALHLVSAIELSLRRIAGGALILGAGIAAMHYVGMAAMRMEPGIEYDPIWFALSIVVAIAAAGAALAIAHSLKREGRGRRSMRAAAAFVMGLAIVGMHYTGMAAARFPVGAICGAALGGGVSQHWLASLVGTSSFAILGLAIIVSLLDSRLQERTAVLARSLHDANEQLTYLALHDPLTRLPNRLLIEDRLEQAIEKARRSSTRFACLFVDLDGFKAINDAHGHPVGDNVLKNIAGSVRARVREQDTVGRIGGDEFVVITEIADPEDAATVAEKILRECCRPVPIARGELRVSASIGIAVYPFDGASAHDLLANADAAMYCVKDQGRNGYRFFEPDMNRDAKEQLALMQDLAHAVEREELFLVYQPKMKALGGPVLGVEALVRWRHPTRGIVMPERFISLAEKNGMIIEVGAWVLDEACRQLAVWRAKDCGIPSVAVNLSALQFRSRSLAAEIRQTLARYGLPANALTVEITESTAMRDPEQSLAILRELADIGIHISIDDFGSGYSSLMYLKKLPASELKIDRGFVKELAQGGEDAAIVAAIVALGRTLRLDVIAEGVETAEQQRMLTDLGCTSLQGFYLGRPVAPGELCPSDDGVRIATAVS